MVLSKIANKVFGSANERKLKKYQPAVQAINDLEPELEALSDDDLKARTVQFREELANGAKLQDLLIPAFATVREAAKRTLGLRPYDVQLIGGMVLNDHAIAEMRTGEGKTLVATLPVYLNALEGKGVHLVTVNDYLATRDAGWMGQIYNFLGLSVGVLHDGIDEETRKAAYACDITYGTNNEFGFDYLRDNMKYDREDMVQRGHNFAIVDEVDSILIDEARTPLIISGPLDDRSDLYYSIDKFIPTLTQDDYEIDEKQRSASFTEEGNEKVENELSNVGLLKGNSLYDSENISLVLHLNNALRAHKLFERDKDYIVKDNQVILIDEFTGRMMAGRRLSEGLHQALEAKENVEIQPENQTLASVTYQNYFRLYDKLAGMTGTALTEAEEFMDIYGLQVLDIPTNLPIQRIDDDDEVYRTEGEKYNAIIELIRECQSRKQPVLVGTTSIEKSEQIASLLSNAGINDFSVLNARYHEQEAHIVAQAGVPGSITIATNMAGRGTDIQLGGNLDMRIENELGEDLEGANAKAKIKKITDDVEQKKVEALEAGGLFVIATERHESRRIDNQLRGRTGRQGDPGRSKFFLSLQDDLMRIFGSDRMENMLVKLGLEEGEAIVHPWINKALERAQKKVEARNFDIRKNILKYDDVMNDQRKVIFEQRLEMMDDDLVKEAAEDMRHTVIEDLVAEFIPERAYPNQWDTESLEAAVNAMLNMQLPVKEWADEEGIDDSDVLERIITASDQAVKAKEEQYTPQFMRHVEKSMILQALDYKWREHLVTLDSLRNVIHYRGYAQRDPLNEYKSEAFSLFESLISGLRQTVVTALSHVEIATSPDEFEGPVPPSEMQTNRSNDTADGPGYNLVQHPRKVNPEERDPTDPSTWGKVRRNEPCPCESGKKYKHCHGA